MTLEKNMKIKSLTLMTLACLPLVATACTTDAAPASGNAQVECQHQVENVSKQALYSAMQTLWAQHMEWTFASIMSLAHYSEAFDATANRLLKNQEDIGNAIKPYYGDAAGTKLTLLLKEHIEYAVEVVNMVKAGDKAKLDYAIAEAYENAKEIADFLADANPKLSRDNVRMMMKVHIDTTLVYATSIVKGDFGKAITEYDAAEKHMLELANTLSMGIISQFPDKFKTVK